VYVPGRPTGNPRLYENSRDYEYRSVARRLPFSISLSTPCWDHYLGCYNHLLFLPRRLTAPGSANSKPKPAPLPLHERMADTYLKRFGGGALAKAKLFRPPKATILFLCHGGNGHALPASSSRAIFFIKSIALNGTHGLSQTPFTHPLLHAGEYLGLPIF
jgi:hypothetical protein